jgi:ATP/maltotriose-dependent transcriptional regulator MalT
VSEEFASREAEIRALEEQNEEMNRQGVEDAETITALRAQLAEAVASRDSYHKTWEAAESENDRLAKRCERIEKALRGLYEDTVEYIVFNNLGNPHRSQVMKDARDVLFPNPAALADGETGAQPTEGDSYSAQVDWQREQDRKTGKEGE